MRHKLHTACGLVLFAVLTADLVLELMPGVGMGAPPKLAFAAAFALLWTLYCLPMRGPRSRRRWLTVLFFYYLWLLLNVLFFDGAFGRSAGARPRYSPGELYELFRVGGVAEGVSMIPLRTIRNYLTAHAFGNISRELVVLNLGGNLAAFAPMGFFLPALYRRQRNFLVFLLTVGLSVVAVEVIQAATGCGSADLDDLILNLAGAAAAWLALLPLTGRLYRTGISNKEGTLP